MLVSASNDPRLPKSAAGLASQLKQLDGRLTADGLSMTCTEGDKKHSARYTIMPTTDASPSTNNNGKNRTMSHRTQYLLESENQAAYNRFAQVDEPERLEAELALRAEPL